MKYLETLIYADVSISLLNESTYKKNLGFKFNKMINVNGKTIALPENGTAFIEDKNGLRFVINFTTQMEFDFFKRPEFSFRIIADGRNKGIEELINTFIKRFEDFALHHCIFSSGVYTVKGKFIETPSIPWEEIKLSRDLKEQIDFHIIRFIENMKKFKRLGIKNSRGIILHGKPGNGKTMLGKVLAANMGIPMIWVTAQTLEHPEEGCINDLFEFANYIAPVIIFIEDGDIYLADRKTNTKQWILSEFMNKLDGLRENKAVLTIVTGNTPEKLDQAIDNRPRRFDVLIEFPNPGEKERREILENALKGHVRKNETTIIDEAAAILKEFSGAHVMEFADRLCIAAIYAGKRYITRDIVSSELKRFGFKPLVGKSGKIGFGREKNLSDVSSKIKELRNA